MRRNPRAPSGSHAPHAMLPSQHGLDGRGCYIVTFAANRLGSTMPTRVPHPHHDHSPGQGHPPAAISPSILRMSVVERLAIAVGLIALVWGAVVWAMKA